MGLGFGVLGQGTVVIGGFQKTSAPAVKLRITSPYSSFNNLWHNATAARLGWLRKQGFAILEAEYLSTKSLYSYSTVHPKTRF